jgi:hypothetical protein
MILVLYNEWVKYHIGLGANVDVGSIDIKLWRYWERPANDVSDSVALAYLDGITVRHPAFGFMSFWRSYNSHRRLFCGITARYSLTLLAGLTGVGVPRYLALPIDVEDKQIFQLFDYSSKLLLRD